jgi:hypothetical protein
MSLKKNNKQDEKKNGFTISWFHGFYLWEPKETEFYGDPKVLLVVCEKVGFLKGLKYDLGHQTCFPEAAS